MEPAEVNVKPKISAVSGTEKSSHTFPAINKLKQSRYEDVWPEDVHAAFMEAVALYPPMGKRRLKYYRVSIHGNERVSNTNRAKSFGRCQLIQSYILEKTGKNRSRKQVSSHLQRLKKIHKDNPAMHHLFSEHPEPSEHSPAPQSVARPSQDISTNISVSTRHLKSDPDLPGTTGLSGLTYPYLPEMATLNGDPCETFNLSTNLYDQPSFFSTQEIFSQAHRQCPAGSLNSSNGNHLSEHQDALSFKDTVNEGLRSGPAPDASAFSISMCRLAKLPVQGRSMSTNPTSMQMHFSRAVHSPNFHPVHHWFSHSSPMDGHSCDSPLISAQEAFYTPLFPLQLAPPEKQRLDHGLEWAWLRNPDMALDPREDTLDEIRLRYFPATYQYNSTCLDSPSGSNALQLPNGIYYSVTSPATTSESVSNEDSVDFPTGRQSPEAFGNLAPPLVVKPTPVYPVSYTHPNIHFNCCTPASESSFLGYQATAPDDHLAQNVSARTHYLMF